MASSQESPASSPDRIALDEEKQSDIATREESPVAKRAEQKEDVPPNGGFGWVCVACAALINGHTWGINSSYGVFLAHYLSHNTFPGATYLDFAFVGGLSISQAMLVSPIATIVTRKYGTRTTLFVGIFFETLALIGASFAKQIWQLFLSQGICFGWGMGFLFVASVGITPQWFSTKRSLANGFAAAGSGLGGLTYSLAANAIIKTISLAWAFRILGIVAGGVNFTCALIIRDRNKQIGVSQLAFDYRLFKRGEFVLIQFWGFFSMLGYVTLLFSLPDYAQSVGLTPHQGSVVGAVLNLGQAFGRPPVGYFSDAMGRINMSMFMSFLSGLFCLIIWIFAKSYGVLIFFAFIGGCVAGTFWVGIAPVGAEVCGLKVLPSVLSITWLFIVLPTTFSEPIALELVQHTPQKYLSTQLFAGFMYIAGAVCLWFVRAWKVGENERAAAAAAEKASSGDAFEASDAAKEQYRVSPLIKRLFALKKV